MRTRALHRLLLLGLLAGPPADLRAAEPTVRNLSPHGLRIGGTTTFVVEGADLGTAPRLLLPFPARQRLKPSPRKDQATFAVTLGGEVEPGYYNVWLVTPDGCSPPVVVAVDRLPQRGMRDTIEQLPTALHGVVVGGTTVETRFQGKAGEQFLIEVEAQRLGSKLHPVVHLRGPKNPQLAWAWPTPGLGGDARLEATLPEAGTYTVALHDLEYAATAPGFFRLRVGRWAFVDQVFPPAVARGPSQTVELLGPSPMPRIDLARRVGALPVPTPREDIFCGPRPFVFVSPHAEVVGQATSGKVQELPAGPVGVSGRLRTPYDEDRYRLRVQPKTKLLLEVFAERYGSPLDPVLVVRNEKGAELARAEDGPDTLDPKLEFTVPDNVTTLVVGVADSQGRAGPRAVYRLVVDPGRAAHRRGGFQLFTPIRCVALPAGGRVVVPVLVVRDGYDGRIELSAEGLPGGARLEGADVPPGADGALVTVLRDGDQAGAAITHWFGRTAEGEERAVTVKGHPLERLQPWLATEIAVAATAVTAAEFQIGWRGLPTEAAIVPASKLPLPVRVRRPPGGGVVRLTLLTSQLRPIVNGQTDPQQSLRLEKPVELPPTATDADPVLLVPPKPAAPVYDITLRAELLNSDRTKVLATTSAPVRRMAVRIPRAKPASKRAVP